MSMTVLTIFQITGVLAAYLGIVLLPPYILLNRKFKAFRAPVKFMAYFIIGNFYIINLALALQLMHISNRFTLIAGTLLPFGVTAAVKYRSMCSVMLEQGLRQTRLVLEKELGFKTFLMRTGKRLRDFASRRMRAWLASRWPDILLTGGIIILVIYMYGTNAIRAYGYCASDVLVHNYWINETGGNRIFPDGIYPFGFHCVVYYLHEVFAVPTYVVLRIFFLIQTLMIHLVLLAFLKTVCKSKYAPYAGVLAYVVSDVFYKYVYIRYYASIPQEFGMLFILPSIYFAIAFLQEKLPASGRKPSGNWKTLRFWKEALNKRYNFYLVMFAAGVSMTLTSHFYDTIVAALLCIGLGVGFCFRCFRWRYLKRIVIAGIGGILLAVLPMGIAYATGIPLQGSLYWGMSVVAPEDEEAGENPEADSPDGGAGQSEGGTAESLHDKWNIVMDKLQHYVAKNSVAAVRFFTASVGILFLLGILWMMFGRPEYGAVLLTFSIFMALLFLIQASKELGIPQLLEESRCPVYIAYGLAVVWSLCADALLYLLFRERPAIHIGSVAAVAAVCAAVVLTGIREHPKIEGMETNGAIVCLTNIISENEESDTWTICSANDELQMARDYGYHYETIDFLREMEDLDKDPVVNIPTDTVYFFIEKEPLMQMGEIGLQKSGKVVSKEGAGQPLPDGGGISAYGEDARWVVMSHMYYWAEAFQRLYPNEMEVYYETDEFICYRVQQNEYSLYNFAIDYGYN